MVGQLEGVDLSAKMLAEARAKGVYDRLVKDEMVEFLVRETGGAELIVAADVFNYVGALEPALLAAHAALVPGGLLAFSLETHAGDAAVLVGASMRFQHAAASALALCGVAGFRLVTVQPEAIRMDRGQPVPGLIVLASRD
jgi:predicted TPR repeat methyltransferase